MQTPFTTPLNSIGVNLNWNGRTAIESTLMELALDIAVNGQEKPAEVVSISKVREFALENPWVAKMLEGQSTEIEWFLLAGHRRHQASQLAVDRGLMPKDRENTFEVEDISHRILKASDLRRANIRENALQLQKSPIEIGNDILRMRDVEGIPVEEIASFYGKTDPKGIKWIKEAAKLAKGLHPSVYAALHAGTIQWSTALEYEKMTPEEQAKQIQRGLTKVAEIKDLRAGREPRVPGSGSVGYKSTKEHLAALDAILTANKGLKDKAAAWQLIHAMTEKLRGGCNMKQFLAKLDAIHDNGNLDTGIMMLKADSEATAEARGENA